MNVRRFIATAGLVALVAAMAPAPDARADLEALTITEFRCRDQLAKALETYGKGRAKCMTNCRRLQLEADCSLPAVGGKTELCLAATEPKLAKVLARCASDGTAEDSCPEGYEAVLSGTCSDFVSSTKSALASAITNAAYLLGCNDGGTLTAPEFTCQWKSSQAYGAWGAARSKCFRNCRIKEARGRTDGNCDPNNTTDTATLACLSKAEGKLQTEFTKHCTDVPECDDPRTLKDREMRLYLEAVAARISNPSTNPVCGNGIRELPEDCDPPGAAAGPQCGTPSATCSASCFCDY